MISEIDRITGPEYIENLTTLSLDDVRSKRAECNAIENAASYVRRFAQARLDMLANPEPGVDVGELPIVLTAREEVPPIDQGSSVLPRPPREFVPGLAADELLAELNRVAPPAELAVAAGNPDRSAELIAALSDYERSISSSRRAIHSVIDLLQSEIVRRYRVGEASVDGLLGD